MLRQLRKKVELLDVVDVTPRDDVDFHKGVLEFITKKTYTYASSPKTTYSSRDDDDGYAYKHWSHLWKGGDDDDDVIVSPFCRKASPPSKSKKVIGGVDDDDTYSSDLCHVNSMIPQKEDDEVTEDETPETRPELDDILDYYNEGWKP